MNNSHRDQGNGKRGFSSDEDPDEERKCTTNKNNNATTIKYFEAKTMTYEVFEAECLAPNAPAIIHHAADGMLQGASSLPSSSSYPVSTGVTSTPQPCWCHTKVDDGVADTAAARKEPPVGGPSSVSNHRSSVPPLLLLPDALQISNLIQFFGPDYRVPVSSSSSSVATTYTAATTSRGMMALSEFERRAKEITATSNDDAIIEKLPTVRRNNSAAVNGIHSSTSQLVDSEEEEEQQVQQQHQLYIKDWHYVREANEMSWQKATITTTTTSREGNVNNNDSRTLPAAAARCRRHWYLPYAVPHYLGEDWLNGYLDQRVGLAQPPGVVGDDNDDVAVKECNVASVDDHEEKEKDRMGGPSCTDYRFVYLGVTARSSTLLHCDVFGSYSWSLNVTGRKLWFFATPYGNELLHCRLSDDDHGVGNCDDEDGEEEEGVVSVLALLKRRHRHTRGGAHHHHQTKRIIGKLTHPLPSWIIPPDPPSVTTTTTTTIGLEGEEEDEEDTSTTSPAAADAVVEVEFDWVVQEQGDLIFVPSLLYHEVHNIPTTIDTTTLRPQAEHSSTIAASRSPPSPTIPTTTVSVNHNWINQYNVERCALMLCREAYKFYRDLSDAEIRRAFCIGDDDEKRDLKKKECGWAVHLERVLMCSGSWNFEAFLDMLHTTTTLTTPPPQQHRHQEEEEEEEGCACRGTTTCTCSCPPLQRPWEDDSGDEAGNNTGEEEVGRRRMKGKRRRRCFGRCCVLARTTALLMDTMDKVFTV